MSKDDYYLPPWSTDSVLSTELYGYRPGADLDIVLGYPVPSEGNPVVVASVYGGDEFSSRETLFTDDRGAATALRIVAAVNATASWSTSGLKGPNAARLLDALGRLDDGTLAVAWDCLEEQRIIGG